MKTSTVLASLLFGSFAAAAPFDKRALVYKTEIVTETVVVYTTVYDDATPAATSSAAPTSSPAAFYEQQKPSPSSALAGYPVASSAAPSVPAVPSASAVPAYTPPAVEQPSPSPSPSPKPAPAPAPQPQPEVQPSPSPSPSPSPAPAPQPQPEPVYTPAPVSSAPASSAPAPASTTAVSAPATNEYPTTGGTSGSATYQDVDITVYDNTGAAGACGEPLTDDMMVVAISKGAWNAKGGSTYDVMTGASSNPWCGTQIQINYNGATAKAKIMDMCPGCAGENDIDLSRGVWKALGITETTRLKASWSVV